MSPVSDYLELLPAVDITEGRAVQLAQGVAGSERVYGDPVAAAMRWQDAGAEWIHLVDLDAAFGRGSNRELQAEIVGALDIKVEFEVPIDREVAVSVNRGVPIALSAPKSPVGKALSDVADTLVPANASSSAADGAKPRGKFLKRG